MLRQQPLVSVGETTTDIPAFVMSSFLCLWQDAERQVHIFYVVFTSKGMDAEKVASKVLAGVPAVLWRYVPVAQFLVA